MHLQPGEVLRVLRESVAGATSMSEPHTCTQDPFGACVACIAVMPLKFTWRQRLDTRRHQAPLKWVLPAWAKAKICDALDREVGMWDDLDD